MIKLKDIRLFLKNWKDRKPMLLKVSDSSKASERQKLENLTKKYEAKGIIKKYYISEPLILSVIYDLYETVYEDFEWI